MSELIQNNAYVFCDVLWTACVSKYIVLEKWIYIVYFPSSAFCKGIYFCVNFAFFQCFSLNTHTFGYFFIFTLIICDLHVLILILTRSSIVTIYMIIIIFN